MLHRLIIILLVSVCAVTGYSQTTDKLEIIQGKIKLNDFESEQQVVRLFKNKQGQAKLKQKSTVIEADEIKNITRSNYAEAYKNVYINHADSVDIYAKTAKYFGDTRKAKLIDDVVLKQDVYTIETNELDYDLNKSIATYTKGGQLSDTTSVLTSEYGTFNTKTEIAVFKQNVVLRTKDRQIETEQLTYNSPTKWAYFKGATKITEQDGRVITTNEGKYNTETGEAVVKENPVIEDDKAIFKANSIEKNGDASKATGGVYYYNKEKQYKLTADNAEQFSEEHIKAVGNVEYYDELKQVKFTANEVERFSEYKAKAKGNILYTDVLKQQEFTAKEVEQFAEHQYKAVGDVYFKDALKQQEFTADEFEQLAENQYKAKGKVYFKDALKQQEFTADEAEQLAENQYKAKGNVQFKDALEGIEFTANEAEQFGEDQLFAKGNVFIQDSKNNLIVKSNELEQFNADKIELRTGVDITNTKDSLNLTASKAIVYKESEIFEAFENVKVQRLNNNTTLLTDSLYFNQKEGIGEAKGRPFLETEDNGDKIYLIAKQLKAIRQNDVDSTFNFLANENVKIFKSDIQAIADSAYVNSVDSVITLAKKPVIWSDSVQMSADTIRIHLKDGGIKKVEFRKNCFFVNLVQGQLYNQMRGREMDAQFANGKLSSLFVDGNAETIFFVQDDNQAFVGVDEMKSGQIDAKFQNGKIDKIYWLKQQEGTTYPFQDVEPESKRFPNFSWRDYEKPTGKDFLLIASGRQQGVLPKRPKTVFEQGKRPKGGDDSEKSRNKSTAKQKTTPKRNNSRKQSGFSLPGVRNNGVLKKGND